MEMEARTDFVWSGALAGWPFSVGFIVARLHAHIL